jgi:hypothetical protein
MKVHLLKSSEVSTDLFTKVVDFLKSIPGPIQFIYDVHATTYFEDEEIYMYQIRDEKHFEKQKSPPQQMKSDLKKYSLELDDIIPSIPSFPLERETITWNALFKKANQYRISNRLPDNEFVLLLTDVANKQNWFAALDESMPYNGFIHTADWDYYIKCSAAFPIAYEVIALVLQKHMFNGLYELRTRVHENPIGCVNDLCMHKRDIILKLRTGDVCEDCIEKAAGKMSVHELHHALHIMSSLREKMLFAQNMKKFSPLSTLKIDTKYKIFLPEFNNIEIKLRPLEKALYFLFMRYPDGIYHSSLSEHRTELYEIYASISTMGDLTEMKYRIDDMVNALNDSASQKISRIKRVFEDAIGPDLAKHYYIKGESGQKKKIDLDPTYFKIINN